MASPKQISAIKKEENNDDKLVVKRESLMVPGSFQEQKPNRKLEDRLEARNDMFGLRRMNTGNTDISNVSSYMDFPSNGRSGRVNTCFSDPMTFRRLNTAQTANTYKSVAFKMDDDLVEIGNRAKKRSKLRSMKTREMSLAVDKRDVELGGAEPEDEASAVRKSRRKFIWKSIVAFLLVIIIIMASLLTEKYRSETRVPTVGEMKKIVADLKVTDPDSKGEENPEMKNLSKEAQDRLVMSVVNEGIVSIKAISQLESDEAGFSAECIAALKEHPQLATIIDADKHWKKTMFWYITDGLCLIGLTLVAVGIHFHRVVHNEDEEEVCSSLDENSNDNTGFVRLGTQFTVRPKQTLGKQNSSVYFKVEDMPKPDDDLFRSLPHQLQMNQITHKDWKLAKKIGEGAYGQVFTAVDNKTGHMFAVKAIWKTGPTKNKAMIQCDREMQILTKLDHPNIVKYLGAHSDHEYFYMYMEYVAGGSLDDLMYESTDPGDNISAPLAQAYSRQILEGLAFLHKHHVVHRDLKPGNVLVTVDGQMKLADFGASFDMTDMTHETKQTAIGTPAYMAPEVIMRDAHCTASDIWSFGAMVFEMVTGDLPFGLKSSNRLFYELSLGKVEIEWPDNIEWPAFEDLVRTCMQADPTTRKTAEELKSHPFFTDKPSVELMSKLDQRKVEIAKSNRTTVRTQKKKTLTSNMPAMHGAPSPAGSSILKHNVLSQTGISEWKSDDYPNNSEVEEWDPDAEDAGVVRRTSTAELRDREMGDKNGKIFKKHEIPSRNRTPSPATRLSTKSSSKLSKKVTRRESWLSHQDSDTSMAAFMVKLETVVHGQNGQKIPNISSSSSSENGVDMDKPMMERTQSSPMPAGPRTNSTPPMPLRNSAPAHVPRPRSAHTSSRSSSPLPPGPQGSSQSSSTRTSRAARLTRGFRGTANLGRADNHTFSRARGRSPMRTTATFGDVSRTTLKRTTKLENSRSPSPQELCRSRSISPKPSNGSARHSVTSLRRQSSSFLHPTDAPPLVPEVSHSTGDSKQRIQQIKCQALRSTLQLPRSVPVGEECDEDEKSSRIMLDCASSSMLSPCSDVSGNHSEAEVTWPLARLKTESSIVLSPKASSPKLSVGSIQFQLPL